MSFTETGDDAEECRWEMWQDWERSKMLKNSRILFIFMFFRPLLESLSFWMVRNHHEGIMAGWIEFLEKFSDLMFRLHKIT